MLPGSVDATRLRISEWPSGRIMSFVMNPSTECEGNIKAGATVEIR